MAKDNLRSALVYSFVAHGLVISCFILKAVFLPESLDDYQAALRVDIVDLPDKLPQRVENDSLPQSSDVLPTKVKEPDPPMKAESLKKEIPDLVVKSKPDPKNANRAQDAILKLRQQMAITEIQKKMMEQSKENIRNELNQKVTQFKGNILSPGTEPTGVSKIQHQNYLADLDRHVKSFWKLPEWLARKSYSAQIRVFINRQGVLLNTKLIRPSGNPDYDEMVIAAVKKADPFPPPPEKFEAIVSIDGMLLGFPE